MLKKERQTIILDILNSEGRVISSELSKRLNVSEDTIRRDLNQLAKNDLLKKVHSGATILGPSVTNFEYRSNIKNEEKEKLVKLALPLLEEHSVFFVDGSTTNLKFVEALPTNFKGTMITNSPYIAIAAIQKKELVTISLGGNFAKRSAVYLGETTIKEIDTIRADYYLMGIHNLDATIGATVNTQQESFTKLKMAEHSEQVIAIATKEKIGTVSHYVSCPIDRISYLVTDSTNDALLTKFENSQIDIITLN
ncbi:DeoR/GlpR transcriptional regulator [Vagococcus sp. BWB3-3]|uniref:Lactose phosphotransferase system repressor n=1 Tax=Vagococcus allomyrinae TaxID=2794353 RepID=A0A940PC75_9ENTE|nr:DeoR/GlpR family DNA-binding transcription regulator [Vagococcus allomyrinae]MBP1040058.1 DeoR/GlpR transcriptional regulator [Vagococcus allomyrinae]